MINKEQIGNMGEKIGEIPPKKNIEERILEGYARRLDILRERYKLEKPPSSVISTCTVSEAIEKGWLEDVFERVKRGKFSGVNLKPGKFSPERVREIKGLLDQFDIRVRSFNGTTHLMGEKQADLTLRDLEIARILDPNESAPICYDIGVADLEILRSVLEGTPYEEVKKKQREKMKKLGFNSEGEIAEYFVREISRAKKMSQSKRPVYFEVPGLLMMSLSENSSDLETLVRIAQKYSQDLGEWGIAIDLAHVFANLGPITLDRLGEIKEKLTAVIENIKKFSQYIKMIHISGPIFPYSGLARPLAAEKGISPSSVETREAHQAVDNQLMLEMVKRIRDIFGNKTLHEVSEIHPINEITIFDEILKFDPTKVRELYLDNIAQQGELMGYGKIDEQEK